MDDNDEDIFLKSLLDRYVHRPPQLEEMSYAEFGATQSYIVMKIKTTVYLQ
jgi:hypothetical protein